MLEVNKIYQGDALEILKTFPNESIHCCVTSPPYWGLRDYGVEGQLGLESTPEEYTSKIVEVFREVRRVLRDDGTLWLNLGDSYIGSGRAGNNPEYWDRHKMFGKTGHNPDVYGRPQPVPMGLKPKDLAGIPWRVAFALQADGWYLRSDIIWHKPNPMPESVKDRPTKSHEYIFLLSKSQKYYYDNKAIKEPVAESTIGRGRVDFGGKKGREYKLQIGDPNYRAGSEQWGRTFDYLESCKNGRNKRTVWTVATKPFKEAHFAVFPSKLIEPCILAGCPKNGIVLDPFMGSGTTAMVAAMYQRNFIGFELNPEYCKMAEKRIEPYLMQQTIFELLKGGHAMNRFKCPACGGNQYTACSTAEGCIYCGHRELVKMEELGPEESEVEEG